MCILFLAVGVFKASPFFLAHNRDEDLSRPTAAMHAWQDVELLGGRDLLRGGTWLAINRRTLRFAALTNLRVHHEEVAEEQQKVSRGAMMTELLLSEEPLEKCLRSLAEARNQYGGFNVICGDLKSLSQCDEDEELDLWYYCNDSEMKPQRLQRGVLYGVSNGHLNEWQKVRRGKKAFDTLLRCQPCDRETLTSKALQVMSDRSVCEEELSTGLPNQEWEKRLSAIFVEYMEELYATMNTTVITSGPCDDSDESAVELQVLEQLHIDLETMKSSACSREFACKVLRERAPDWHLMAPMPANTTPRMLL